MRIGHGVRKTSFSLLSSAFSGVPELMFPVELATLQALPPPFLDTSSDDDLLSLNQPDRRWSSLRYKRRRGYLEEFPFEPFLPVKRADTSYCPGPGVISLLFKNLEI